MSAISIQKLHKIYANKTHALKGLSFEIKKGEFFGLLGPNGSGKTTLINILAGPTKKTSGHVKIFGKDIIEKREETKMMMGVVPQEISFDSFFSVNEILQLESGYYGIKNNQKYIDEILEKLDLAPKKHTNSRALSGGMKRRLLVAKALVHKPKVLVLDEPTAGVDVELRHNLWKYMEKLNKEGQTILLTTHYLEEAESLCGRIAIINEGNLVALDKTKKLIKSMGNFKHITVTFEGKIARPPQSLEEFNPKMINGNELQFEFKTTEIRKVLESLTHVNNIEDIDLNGQKLEDVFIKLTTKKK